MRTGTIGRAVAVVALVVAGLGLLGGCGGKGSGGGPAGPNVHAPTVTDLQVRAATAEKAGQRIVWVVRATVTDPEGDVLGGQAEARIEQTGQVVSATIDANFLHGAQFACTLSVENPPPGRIDVVFSIVDAAGNRSNEVAFFVNVAAEALRGTAPGPTRMELVPVR